MKLRNDIFNNFAIDFKNVIESEYEYFSEYLENYPNLVFNVSDICFDYFMKNFEKEIRKGIENNFNVCFTISKANSKQKFKSII